MAGDQSRTPPPTTVVADAATIEAHADLYDRYRAAVRDLSPLAAGRTQ
jgi:hypothetical protein